ncbi:hypothetical protein, partial [Bradyrhizobium sp. 151]|uniref:hypothetical protein n=1 Tax=Bradyrhizobium sp. 151 TaxID=2782626 RepID=UPI001FF7D243
DHRLPSQGVHLFWWTPHASEHSKAKGAGKFALTEIQRLVPSAFDMRDPDRAGYIVGGLGMLTTITRDGISTKVLKRWPDKVGSLIGEPALV